MIQERETERQRDRETERQRDRETEKKENKYLVDVEAEEVEGCVDGLDLPDLDEPDLEVLGGL